MRALPVVPTSRTLVSTFGPHTMPVPCLFTLQYSCPRAEPVQQNVIEIEFSEDLWNFRTEHPRLRFATCLLSRFELPLRPLFTQSDRPVVLRRSRRSWLSPSPSMRVARTLLHAGVARRSLASFLRVLLEPLPATRLLLRREP
jgi:hypothetical protein